MKRPLIWPAGFTIAPAKITDYLLNHEHREGGPKCAFLSAFGFSPQDPQALHVAIVGHAVIANFADTKPAREAVKLLFEGRLASPVRVGPNVRTVWQLDDDDTLRFARFITLKPLPRTTGARIIARLIR